MAKILLVEDNEMNRICFQASGPAHEAFIAADGAEGGRWRLRKVPDLILMDMASHARGKQPSKLLRSETSRIPGGLR